MSPLTVPWAVDLPQLIGKVQGLLESKDTRRPEEGPMLLGIDPP